MVLLCCLVKSFINFNPSKGLEKGCSVLKYACVHVQESCTIFVKNGIFMRRYGWSLPLCKYLPCDRRACTVLF